MYTIPPFLFPLQLYYSNTHSSWKQDAILKTLHFAPDSHYYVLMSETTAYENHLNEKELRWFAVYTKYRREKQVLKRLQQKGVEVYLPLQRLVRRHVRKVRVVELPVISCYIFVRITKSAYVPVLETTDVVNFVKFSHNLIAIPDQEMMTLQQIVNEGLPVEAVRNGYEVGDAVEITAGNLKGLQGILLKKNTNNNFLIDLSKIGYSLLMQVDPGILKRINL